MHHYRTRITWTGNLGSGTAGYRAYARDFIASIPGKPDIAGSSDPAFRGDPARWNPEDMLLAAISACHKLWYLHLCADHGIVVMAYEDDAEATMDTGSAEAPGHFVSATLKPRVTVAAGADKALALALHEKAHHACFIANSLNFPVRCHAQIIVLES